MQFTIKIEIELNYYSKSTIAVLQLNKEIKNLC